MRRGGVVVSGNLRSRSASENNIIFRKFPVLSRWYQFIGVVSTETEI
jgi:hypothetical protein